jgi:chromosome segregation ATPase
MDGVTLDLVTAYERIADLEHNLADSDHQVDILQTCVGDYERMQADAARELMAAEAELARLREENLQLRADRGMFPFWRCLLVEAHKKY